VLLLVRQSRGIREIQKGNDPLLKKIDERLVIRIAPFGMDFVLSLYGLAAPLLLITMKANPIELGLIGSMTSVVHMGMAHRIGPLSDRFGRRRLILIAPLLLTLSAVIAAITESVKVVLLLSALNGLCLSLFWPPMQAWVAEFQAGSGLARNIGTLNLAWTAAYVVGPVISGLLFRIQPRLPFVSAAFFSVLLFFLGYTSIHDRNPAAGQKEISPQHETSEKGRDFLYAVWIANFMSWFLLGNARYQFPKLATELGSPPQVVGLLIGSLGLSLFFGFLILRTSSLWHDRRRYLFGGQALGVAGVGLLCFAGSPALLAAALILIGLSASVTYYSSLLYAVRFSPQKGKGTGRHESILSMGALLGPLLGGLSAYYISLRAPYIVCLFFLFMAIVCEAVLLRRKSR
jgi:MFS family permease